MRIHNFSFVLSAMITPGQEQIKTQNKTHPQSSTLHSYEKEVKREEERGMNSYSVNAGPYN